MRGLSLAVDDKLSTLTAMPPRERPGIIPLNDRKPPVGYTRVDRATVMPPSVMLIYQLLEADGGESSVVSWRSEVFC